jgi:hypothetical protein
MPFVDERCCRAALLLSVICFFCSAVKLFCLSLYSALLRVLISSFC